jgi:hypothetical protein
MADQDDIEPKENQKNLRIIDVLPISIPLTVGFVLLHLALYQTYHITTRERGSLGILFGEPFFLIPVNAIILLAAWKILKGRENMKGMLIGTIMVVNIAALVLLWMYYSKSGFRP